MKNSVYALPGHWVLAGRGLVSPIEDGLMVATVIGCQVVGWWLMLGLVWSLRSPTLTYQRLHHELYFPRPP